MDTIADMLTTIINAQRVHKQRVIVPYSRFKATLARLLQTKGLLAQVRVKEGTRAQLVLTLAYGDDGQQVITGVKRLSTPSQRRYVKRHHIPYTFSQKSMIILATPRGLMDATQARAAGVGGELICEIW